MKLHVLWNFQVQRFLGPQLMCWSHCFTELEATASNTLNIKHHQWINSVQQNINFGSFHFSFLSTHKDCFSNAKQGGGAEQFACIVLAEALQLVVWVLLYLHRCIIAARFHYLYHCSVVEGSLTSSIIPWSVPGSGRIFCIFAFYIFITLCLYFSFGICICTLLFLYFVFVFHYHCWPSSVVVS